MAKDVASRPRDLPRAHSFRFFKITIKLVIAPSEKESPPSQTHARFGPQSRSCCWRLLPRSFSWAKNSAWKVLFFFSATLKKASPRRLPPDDEMSSRVFPASTTQRREKGFPIPTQPQLLRPPNLTGMTLRSLVIKRG